MIKCLIKSFEIDVAYSTNSFIYILSKLPILEDLITNDIYKDKVIKKIIGFFVIIFNFFRALAIKFLYFLTIMIISYKLFPDSLVKTYFHIYFFLTIIGMFINNKLLNTNKKKYFSILIFNMDATKFFKSNILWNQISTAFLNSLCVFFFGYIIMSPIRYSVMLIVLSSTVRMVGEALNIMFYKKYKYIWYSNNKLYFSVLAIFSLCILLPYINIFLPLNIIEIITYIFIILATFALNYLLNIKDFRLIYKRLSQVVNVMDHKNEKDYLKQAMVEVREKDKKIDLKTIEGKSGFDFFNAIFYERHKEILVRSAKKYSIILTIIYIVATILLLKNNKYYETINNFYLTKLGLFALIMFIVNRGAIITQAMFFNCDHAMLRYNFYREPKNILKLFKIRLIMLIKVNLIPAIIMAVGNTVLLILLKKNLLFIMTSIVYIISLSILFSVHYLVIYYLFQPFDKEMEVKKMSYSIMTLLTYIFTYSLTKYTFNSLTLSIGVTLFTIIYTISSLILIYKYADKTFKLN